MIYHGSLINDQRQFRFRYGCAGLHLSLRRGGVSFLFSPSSAPCLRRGRRARAIRLAWLRGRGRGGQSPAGAAGRRASAQKAKRHPEPGTNPAQSRQSGPRPAGRKGDRPSETPVPQAPQGRPAARAYARQAKRPGWAAPACPCEGRGHLRDKTKDSGGDAKPLRGHAIACPRCDDGFGGGCV